MRKLYTLTPKRLATKMEVEDLTEDPPLRVTLVPVAKMGPIASKQNSPRDMATLASIQQLQTASQTHESSLKKLESCCASLTDMT
jgi:hypothetical protein